MQSIKLAATVGRKWAVKNAPDILIGASIATSTLAVGLTIPATTRANELIKRKESETRMKASAKGETYDGLGAFEKVKTCWTCYVPTLLTLGTSIATAVYSNRVSAGRIAALATAYSLSEKSFRDYQEKVTEMIGEDREKKVHDRIAEDYNKSHPVVEQQVEHTGNGEYLVRDLETGRDFRTTQERVYQAFKRISDNLVSQQSQSLNDLYDELGLSNSETGYMLGWTTADWPLEPKFSTMIADNGEPCLTISYRIGTIYDFRDY